MDYGAEAIRRHRESRGKVAIQPKMRLQDMDDLSIAYTPGVASVSLAIAENKAESFELTNRANSVAVVSDGSAVLGLGNVGPEAAMAVMEGKAVLFKILADIDAIPICLGTQDDDALINTVRYLVPSFGGINLEDISAPGCFYIEESLQDLGIPIFHDDQHGTAVVTLAALINALEVTGKKLEEVKVVFSGAGAAGIATTRLLVAHGAQNVILVDRQGIIHRDRTDLNSTKRAILDVSNPENQQGDLADALRGADVFIGVSAEGLVTEEMVRSMARDSIIFAMANPVPEIMPDVAYNGGAAVIGTGRSDFPNQINNSLAFPGIFRGALDVRAPRISTNMEIAAAKALASLVPEPTTDRILPYTLDRIVVPAVAQAIRDTWQADKEGAQPL